ncbi:MAG: ParB/RepB/Spo0J family partition protein [Spirochaetia bacterium]|nr:ParB/RepB/Spo0J family partition protein [Spirochaetia bacterium]
MSSKHKDIGLLADVFRRETLDGSITRLRLDQIQPSDYQPRQDRLREIDELAASIKRDGLLHPIVVTKSGDSYKIISGERRFHALKSIGAKEAECRILSRESRDLQRIAIIENLQRVDLTAQEEAIALLKLKRQEDYSDQDLSEKVGKSRNYVTEILGIATLPEALLRQCLDAGIISKNLMIQMVQSYRKGEHLEFIRAFQAGEIQTVREAKGFNRGDSKPVTKPSKPSASAYTPTVTVEKNTVRITYKSESDARAALSRLKKLL